MIWDVEFHDEFDAEFERLAFEVQDELLAMAQQLAAFGPSAWRPRVDTLNGSRHRNMKEVCGSRRRAGSGGWHFAFDPRRRAILLVAGDKAAVGQKRFYRRLLDKADSRLDAHLGWLKG